MKNFIYLIILFTLMIMTNSCEKDKNEELNFTEYPDYFATYQDNIDIQGAFLMFNDTAELYSAFHPAATMDNQDWITPADFKDKIAVGIIKEFNQVCTCPNLTIKSIELIDKTVVYKYTLTGIDNNGNISCDMMCRPNLLVLINRNSFTSIEFYENDKLIKTINR